MCFTSEVGRLREEGQVFRVPLDRRESEKGWQRIWELAGKILDNISELVEMG